MANTKSNEAVTLVAGNKYEIIRVSAVRRLIAYPTHYLLVVHDGNQSETYILDTTAFEEAYVSEYGKIEDEARHRTVIAAELFRAVMEGGKAFKVSAQGAAASLIAE